MACFFFDVSISRGFAGLFYLSCFYGFLWFSFFFGMVLSRVFVPLVVVKADFRGVFGAGFVDVGDIA